jgi:hypothetical protein
MPDHFVRTADPYRDLDVIDARAPRFNQATIGTLSLVAVASGWWPILALLAAQLAISLRFGRRWCLPCRAYFELVQPRFGEGPVEDSRPPKFANQVGLSVLTAASAAYLVGAPALGAALGLLVAGLALLAALTGFCAGCWVYRLGARLRGIGRRRVDELALAELGITDSTPGERVVAFTHPLCTDCRDLVTELRATGQRVDAIDVRERPDLARKYGVAVVPMAFTVDQGGAVQSVRRW